MEGNLDQWKLILANIDERYEQFCELTAFSTVRMQAQNDRINYLYDYGDGGKCQSNSRRITMRTTLKDKMVL